MMSEKRDFSTSASLGTPAAGGPFHPGVAPPGSGTGVPAITLGAVLHAVRRWWKWATPFGLLFGALAGGAVWYLFEPQFMASRLITISDETPYIAFEQGGGTNRFAQTEIDTIQSPIVMRHVVARPEIGQMEELRGVGSPVDWILEHTKVSALGKSQLYWVSFEGPNPDHAVTIVNAIVDAYMDRVKSSGVKEKTALRGNLEKELERREVIVEALQREVYSAARDVVTEIAEKELVFTDLNDLVSAGSQFGRLQASRTNLEVEMTILRAQRDQLKKDIDSLDIKVPEELIEQGLAQDSEILALERVLNEARSNLASRASLGAPGHKDRYLSSTETAIESLEQQLEERIEEVRPLLMKQAEAFARALSEEQLKELDEQIKAKELTQQLLGVSIDKHREELQRESVDSLKLDFARADFDQAKEVYNRISARLEKMNTESAAPLRVTPDQATLPEDFKQTKKHKIPRIILACAAGFGCPFFFAILWEMKTRRIGESNEISGETPIKVVGEISALPTRPSRLRRRSSGYYYYRNTFEESVDYLRTSLLLSDNFHDLRVVAVASAVSREGKTSLASHLAVSLARAMKEPTLLIDADMRKPGIHELFDVPLSPGLADLLDGQCVIEDALAVDAVPNLHILPAGQLSTSPHVLLANGALRSLLHQARSKYRYVIVDSPPVLPVSDALVIAKACDGTLISTMRDVSRGPQVRQACERLNAAGAHLIGAVLSGVPPRNYVSRYGPYSYHYQRYTGNQPPAAELDVDEAT